MRILSRQTFISFKTNTSRSYILLDLILSKQRIFHIYLCSCQVITTFSLIPLVHKKKEKTQVTCFESWNDLILQISFNTVVRLMYGKTGLSTAIYAAKNHFSRFALLSLFQTSSHFLHCINLV